MRYDCLINLLEQASNIHSLTVDPTIDIMTRTIDGENIQSMIIRYVNRSKLRHLAIRVVHIDQVQMLLDQLRNVSSLRFLFGIESIRSEEIIEHATTLMPACSISHDCSSVSIWMDQRVEKTNAFQCLKLFDEVEDS